LAFVVLIGLFIYMHAKMLYGITATTTLEIEVTPKSSAMGQFAVLKEKD